MDNINTTLLNQKSSVVENTSVEDTFVVPTNTTVNKPIKESGRMSNFLEKVKKKMLDIVNSIKSFFGKYERKTQYKEWEDIRNRTTTNGEEKPLFLSLNIEDLRKNESAERFQHRLNLERDGLIIKGYSREEATKLAKERVEDYRDPNKTKNSGEKPLFLSLNVEDLRKNESAGRFQHRLNLERDGLIIKGYSREEATKLAKERVKDYRTSHREAENQER